MGEDWKYYDVEDYTRWKRSQGTGFKRPPRANFLAAASHLGSFFETKSINWAALGGLAMLCLGSHREMSDLHIIYDTQDFNRLKKKLDSDQRIRLPKTMNSLFPTKILVATGPQFKDSCTTSADIEVDLCPPGTHGSPTDDILVKNQVLLRFDMDGKTKNFKGLNMFYLVRTTLQLCKSRDLAWDPREDLAFLCHYGQEIGAFRHLLNQQELQSLFFTSPFFASLPTDQQRHCTQVLLGRDPIPPPRSASQSRPLAGLPQDLQRPHSQPQTNQQRISSQRSAPQLNIQTSAYAIPPLPPRPQEKSPPQVPLRNAAIPVDAVATNHSRQHSLGSRGSGQTQSRSRNPNYQPTPGIAYRPGSQEGRKMTQQVASAVPSQHQPRVPQPQAATIQGSFSRNHSARGQHTSTSGSNQGQARGPIPVFGPHGGQGVAIHSSNKSWHNQNHPLHHTNTFVSTIRQDTRQGYTLHDRHDSANGRTPSPPQANGLKLVGPEGLYAPPPPPPKPASHGAFAAELSANPTPKPQELPGAHINEVPKPMTLTPSPPSMALPASLMIGGGASHHRAVSNPYASSQPHVEIASSQTLPHQRGQSVGAPSAPQPTSSVYQAYASSPAQPGQQIYTAYHAPSQQAPKRVPQQQQSTYPETLCITQPIAPTQPPPLNIIKATPPPQSHLPSSSRAHSDPLETVTLINTMINESHYNIEPSPVSAAISMDGNDKYLVNDVGLQSAGPSPLSAPVSSAGVSATLEMAFVGGYDYFDAPGVGYYGSSAVVVNIDAENEAKEAKRAEAMQAQKRKEEDARILKEKEEEEEKFRKQMREEEKLSKQKEEEEEIRKQKKTQQERIRREKEEEDEKRIRKQNQAEQENFRKQTTTSTTTISAPPMVVFPITPDPEQASEKFRNEKPPIVTPPSPAESEKGYWSQTKHTLTIKTPSSSPHLGSASPILLSGSSSPTNHNAVSSTLLPSNGEEKIQHQRSRSRSQELADEYGKMVGMDRVHEFLASPAVRRQKTFFDGEFEWEDDE